MNYVNVYEVTRHFGGYEEGGWWFNWYSCVETKEVSEENQDSIVYELEKKYSKLAKGNIYSANGGIDYEVLVEKKPKESETLQAPMYE